MLGQCYIDFLGIMEQHLQDTCKNRHACVSASRFVSSQRRSIDRFHSRVMFRLLLAISVGFTSCDDCVPYISEISTLYLTNIHRLEYMELSVPSSCRENQQAMKSLSLADYGLVVISTKAREVC